MHNLAFPRLALQQLDGQIEVIAHHLLDVVNADFACGVLDKLVNHVLGQIQGDGLAVQACLGDQRDQCAFQFTHVGGDAVGEVFDDFSRQFDAVGVHLLLQDGHARLKRGHLKVGAQTPLEAREEALLHALHFNGWLVRGENDLFAGLVKVIEDVEEHILRLFLSTEELHVVDDQHVHHLIEVAEVVDRVVSHCVNELMREALRADVEDGFVRLAALDFQPNGMCEVGFSEPNPSVN